MNQNQLFMKTYSGEVYEVELPIKVEPQKQTLCFQYTFSQNFFFNELAEEKTKLRKQKAFRQLYRNQPTSQENNSYLFYHVQGRTIDQELIIEQSNKRSKIPIEKINVYLKQILKDLYDLHRQGILGRVFSPSNIIDSKENGLVFMDFGFGPDLYQPGLDIIAPPEIVEQLKLKQQQQTELKYDIKLDSWLLGALLYYLVKTIPVNAIQDNNSGNYNILKYNQKDLELYDSFFKQEAKLNQKCRSLISSRFTLEFCSFVSQLLTYNAQNRLSFSEIYKNQHVKGLKITNDEEIIKFYENLEKDQSKLMYKVHQRERQILSYVFQTKKPISINNQICSYLNINELFIYNYQDCEVIKDLNQRSKFRKNWVYINMEQFKFFLLNNTADDIILHFSGQNYGLKHIAAFILRKMSLLILKQLIFNLDNTESPWKQIDNNQWKQFQSQYQCIALLKELKQEKKKLKTSLIQYFQQYCEKKQTQKLNQKVRESLKQDTENKFCFNQSPQDFCKNGFRQITKNINEFLKTSSNESQMFKQILFKITICHFMNKLLNLDTINDQFKYIKPQLDNYVTPNDIYLFINSQNNQTEQKEQIKLIISKNQMQQE